MSLKKIRKIGEKNDMIRRRGIMKAYKSKAIRRIKEIAEKNDNDQWGLKKSNQIFKMATPKKGAAKINLRVVESPGKTKSMTSIASFTKNRPGTAKSRSK